MNNYEIELEKMIGGDKNESKERKPSVEKSRITTEVSIVETTSRIE